MAPETKNDNLHMSIIMRKIFILFAAALCCATVFATEGALNGKFTINEQGDQIVFSKGNLQYVGTWQFATNQWDTIGALQADDNRDLFGWGTGDAPNKISIYDSDYASFTDWGTNPITNGGNEANLWRTPTTDEWAYLLRTRSNAATLFALGSVDGVNGLILLPDDWTLPDGAAFTASTTVGLKYQDGDYFGKNGDNHYLDDTYDVDQWKVMESAGAVFLPSAGSRDDGTVLTYVGWSGMYWSSTPNGTENANCIQVSQYGFRPQDWFPRYCGFSVRLVQAAQSEETAIENANANAKAAKRLVNGQLVVEKNGCTYNAIGVEVK